MLDNFYIYSDFSMRCIRRTTRGCRPYRSALSGCRFGRSRSSELVGRLFRLRLSNREPVPRARSCRDRCRYRYICRPKRIQFPLRGRLKLLHFLGELGIEFVTAGEFTLCAFDFGNDFVVEADLVQVPAAVIQVVDQSAVGQDGGGTVAVEVVVVADAFGNGQVQHVVLRIAPVGFRQTVSGVLFFRRHFPLVLAVFVVYEAGKGKRIGQSRLK